MTAVGTRAVDLAVRLKIDGYRAFDRDRAARGAEAGRSYGTRLLGRRARVVVGPEDAAVFYDEDVVRRGGAIPPPLALLLFGRGAVHGLDDAPHRDRKRLFLDHLDPGQLSDCAETAGELLAKRLVSEPDAEVSLHEVLVDVYGTAVLDWAGVDVPAHVAVSLARSYAAVVAGFGFADAGAYGRAWRHRRRTDRWAAALIGEVRAGRVHPRPGTALVAVAASDLDDRTAAVELGNLLRPTVAVSWLGAFAGLALDGLGRTPGWRELLASPAGGDARLAVAQEVRRLTPFAPALAARVRRRDERLPGLEPDDAVVLDIRGTNLHPDTWPDPSAFRPERFLTDAGTARLPGPFDLVPQGGGDRVTGHRCPGESMTLQLLSATLRVLAGASWTLTSQPLTDLARIPTLPRGGARLQLAATAHG